MSGTDAPDMKAAALELHDAGWWPIPNHWITSNGKCSCLTFEPKKKECTSPGKHPLIRWEEAQTRQLTRDEIEIYWETWPLANIGVITGPESGIVCLDVDVKDGVDGNQTIKDHADAGRILPETFTDARGDGSKHPFFRYPQNAPAELRNIQDGKLGPGLDLRAAGGQVIIAPSMHFSGERRRIVDPRPPVDLPQWVIDLALSTQKPEKTHGNAPVPHQQVNEKGSGLPPNDRKRLISAYAKKHFPDKVVSGNRHHALMQIGGLMRSAGSDAEEIFDYLTEFNRAKCNPPKPDADDEIREIAGYLMERPVTIDARDEIMITHTPLPELTDDALRALNRKNNPPRLFARSGIMVHVDRDEKGVPFIRNLNEHALKGELARACEWKRATKEGIVDTSPPLEIARDILTRPVIEWDLPPLEAITQTPIIHLDGSILQPGYDPETRTFYQPEPGFILPDVPDAPGKEEVTAARDVIDEPFRDFPFVDECARTNAKGALLTAILRPIIDGPVPCFVCDKPQAGSGASLLQKTIYAIATGMEPEEKGAPKKEEEWDKRLLAILRSGRPVAIFDNIEGTFRSENFARVLTSRECGGRLLGVTEEVSFPNRCTWMANGNNIQIGGDLARRVYLTRIDPQHAIPWQRTGFIHPDLLSWSRDHRGEIVGACLTLVRAWIRGGCPEPKTVPLFGGFDTWRDMVGGVLEHNGISDFLKNAVDVYLEGDADLREEETFITGLHETFKEQTWTVRDLIDVLKNETVVPGKLNLAQCLPERLSATWKKGDDSFSKSAGKALRRYAGKRYPCGLMIEKHDMDLTTKVWIWCIKEFSSEIPQDTNSTKPNPVKPGNPDDECRDSRVIGVSGVSCSLTHEKNKGDITSGSRVCIGCSETPQTPNPGTPQNPIRFISVRILADLPTFRGTDDRTYTLKREDVTTISEQDGRNLITRGVALEVHPGSSLPIRVPRERAIHIDEEGEPNA